MNKILRSVTFFLLFVSNLLLAQREGLVFVNANTYVGNLVGYETSLNYALTQNFSIKAGYSSFSQTAKGLPDDFEEGFASIFEDTDLPMDEVQSYSLMVGSSYLLNAANQITFVPHLGVGLSRVKIPNNWIKDESDPWLSNYRFDNQPATKISLVLNPEIRFPVTPFLGSILVCWLSLMRSNWFMALLWVAY